MDDSVPQKFDLKKTKVTPIADDAPAKFDLSATPVTPIGGEDFTRKIKGKENEGLYRMLPASMQDYTDTSKEVMVPYSRVSDALSSGRFRLHPDEEDRFKKDSEHENQGPTLIERASAKIQSLLQPSTGKVGTMPIGIVPGVDVNEAKAAGRVFTALPGFIKDLGTAYLNVAAGNEHYTTLLDLVDPGQVPVQLQQQFHEDLKTDPTGKLAADNLVGTLMGMGLIAKAPEAARSGAKSAAEAAGISTGKPVEALRNEVRDTLGVWGNTRSVIKKFGKESEDTRTENRNQEQQHLEKTQDALHATHGVELRHEAEVRLSESKAAEENAAAAQRHLEETQEALHKTAGSEMEAERENRKAKIDTLKKQQKEEREYRATVEEVRKHNEEVLRDRDKRVQAQQKLDTASEELDDKIADAQKKAKDADDAAWDAWRAKIGNAQVNLDPVASVIKAQEDKMNPQQVAEFRDILKESEKSGSGTDALNKASQQAFGANYDGLTQSQKDVIDQDFSQRGVSVAQGGSADTPISRLHGWKTQLEDAVRSDRAGNIKYAIGQVLDAVRKLEDSVSKEAGADDLLKKARALHGPYVDTFRNPQTTPSTAANYVRSKVTPNFTKDTKLEAYITRLGGYDPSIPKIVSHIDNLQDGLKALPKDAPLREQIKPYPPKPQPVPSPTLKTPERTPLPDRPVPVEPAAVKEPERTAPPDRPAEVPRPEAPNLQAENAQFIADKLRAYGKYGQWVVRLLFGGGMAVLMKGKSPEFGGDLLLGSIGVNVLTHALRAPRVLDWLAKPSAEDMKIIASLPPEDAAKLREALGNLAEEEREKDPSAANVKIAPIMAAWLAGGKAAPQPPSLPDMKKQADTLNPPAAPGPQGSAQPYTHIFDPTTGNIVAA
jgi:hypothetical protein